MSEDVKEALKMATDRLEAGDEEGWRALVKLARQMAGKE